MLAAESADMSSLTSRWIIPHTLLKFSGHSYNISFPVSHLFPSLHHFLSVLLQLSLSSPNPIFSTKYKKPVMKVSLSHPIP